MRIDFGPGYRVHFVLRGEALVILVAGDDKRTQNRDIAMAIKLRATRISLIIWRPCSKTATQSWWPQL